MKICKSCQKEIDDKAKRCPHCTSDQRVWFAKHPFITIILAFIIVGMFSSGKSDKVQPSDISSNKTVSNEPTPTPDPNPHFKDGSLEVGKDIQPGTYRTRVASTGCYYSRLSGFGGTLNEILMNENTDAPAVITIMPNDKGFKSTRCGTWTQDLSQITSSKTTFDNGIFIVGTDIEPGTYKNSGQTGCYYARLKDFTGGLSSIITNENTDDVARVTIATTDKGFKSTRCGAWTKQ